MFCFFSVAQGFVDVGFSQLMLLSCLISRDLTPWVWVSEWEGWWGLGGDPTLSAPTLRRTAQLLAGRGTASKQNPAHGAAPCPGGGAWVFFPHPSTRRVRDTRRGRSQACQGRSGSETGVPMPGDPPEVDDPPEV